MALITDAATAWSAPIVLAEDEVWQARKGAVFVTTTVSPDAEDGVALTENTAIQLSAGRTVRYRKIAATEAVIVREVV